MKNRKTFHSADADIIKNPKIAAKDECKWFYDFEKIWKYNSSFVIFELMTLKSELYFRGYKMQKINDGICYLVGPVDNEWYFECSWEFLLTEGDSDEIIGVLEGLASDKTHTQFRLLKKHRR